MEKLIRLINEYGHTSNCWPFEDCRIEPATEWNSSYLVLSRDDNWEWDWKDWHLEIPRLISKEYWFIKWLVENEKIDFSNIPSKILDMSLPKFIWGKIQYVFAITNLYWLLMLLAIQDNPIDFLCGILK